MNCLTVCKSCGITVSEILTIWARTLGQSRIPQCHRDSTSNCLLDQMGFASDPNHVHDPNYDSIRLAAGARYLNHGIIPQHIRLRELRAISLEQRNGS